MVNADIGAIRTLVVSARLEDAGVTKGLAEIQAKSGAASAALGGTAQSAAALQSQLFFLGSAAAVAAAGLVNRSAVFEESMTRASLAATGTTEKMGDLEDQTFSLSRRFQAVPTNMADTIRTVQELGVESDKARESLTAASAALSLFAGDELDRETAAQSLFRLIRLTSDSQAELEKAAGSARAYASSIEVAGDMTAGGIDRSVEAIEAFASLGNIANFTRGEIISLASAFTDMESGRFQRVARSLQRMFGREFLETESFQRLVQFMNITPQRFEQLRRQDPDRLLTRLGQSLRDLPRAERLSTVRALGFTNVRDVQTLSQFIGALGKYNRILPKTNKEIQRFQSGNIENTAFMSRMEAQTETTSARFRGLVGELERVAITMGQVVEFGVVPLLEGLRAIARLLSDNPILAGALAVGAFGIAGGALARGVGTLVEFGAAGVPGAGLFGVTRARAAAAGGIGKRMMTQKGMSRLIAASVGGEAAVRAAGGGRLRALIQRVPGAQKFFQKLSKLASPRTLSAFTKIGSVVLILAAAAPALTSLANSVEGLAEEESALGAVASIIEVIARGIAFLGHSLRAMFGVILDFLNQANERLGGALKGALGGAAAGGAIGFLGGPIGAGGGALIGAGLGLFAPEITGGLGATSDAIARQNRRLSGEERSSGPDTVNDITVNAEEADPAIREMEGTLARSRSTSPGTAQTRTRRGSPS